jgi:hypothetical protein
MSENTNLGLFSDVIIYEVYVKVRIDASRLVLFVTLRQENVVCIRFCLLMRRGHISVYFRTKTVEMRRDTCLISYKLIIFHKDFILCTPFCRLRRIAD